MLLVILASCGNKESFHQKMNFNEIDSWSIDHDTLIDQENQREIVRVFQLTEQGETIEVEMQELIRLFSELNEEDQSTDKMSESSNQEKLVIKDIAPVTSDAASPVLIEQIVKLDIEPFAITSGNKPLNIQSESLKAIELEKKTVHNETTLTPFKIGEENTNAAHGISYIPIYQYHLIREKDGNFYDVYSPDCNENGVSNGYYVVIKKNL